MTPERYQRINALADAALDLPPAERAAYLDRACGSDPHLREQVQHLVDAHSTDDDFLEAPALEVLAKDLAGASAPHNLGAGRSASIASSPGWAPEELAKSGWRAIPSLRAKWP